MAYLDSQDCAKRVKWRLARPSTDEAFTESTADDILYGLMSEAQSDITMRFAIYVPDALWTVPLTLSTTDSGKTWGFGTDVDSASIFALGHVRLYDSLAAIPDQPLVEGLDYTWEGTQVRTPNDRTSSYADGGPYAQYVAPSNVITSSTQPTIPIMARLALVSLTAAKCAERLGNATKATQQMAHYEADWMQILTAIRTQGWGKGGTVMQPWGRA